LKKCLLVFGSHADDHEGSHGGLMLKCLDAGWRVVMVMGTCNLSGIRGDLTPREVWERRTREAREAAASLGVETVWLDLKQITGGARDRSLFLEWRSLDPEAEDLPECCRDRLPVIVACEDDAEIERVAALFVEREPELAVTHPVNDLGTEHHALTALVVQAWDRASRRVSLGSLCSWVRTEAINVNLPADVVVDISPYAERAIQAAAKHASQGFNDPKRGDQARRVWRYWGSRIGVRYGQGYRLLRGGPASARPAG